MPLEGNTEEVIARLERVRQRHDSVEVISTLALARAHAGDLGDAHRLAMSSWRHPGGFRGTSGGPGCSATSPR